MDDHLNWNGGDDTLACLASVFASDCPGELVVYVPDNGSTDGSRERVREAFPRARVIENGGNLGFSGGNNPGWRAAVRDGARWVFFLNNDAAVAPDCLRRMVETCEAHPEIGAASPRIYHGAAPGPGEPGGGLDRDIWFEKGLSHLDRFSSHTHVEATPGERASAWYESDVATGCGLLIRAETLERTGGFDEGFFAYFEDVDLSFKVRALGLKCAVIPDAHAWHKVSQSTGNALSPTAVFYPSRNGHYVARRHAGRPGVWATYRRRFPMGAIRFVYWMTRGRDLDAGAASVQGIRSALAGQSGIRPAPGSGDRVLARIIHGSYGVSSAITRPLAKLKRMVRPSRPGSPAGDGSREGHLEDATAPR